MPVTKTLTLYSIDELDDKAREKALDWMRYNLDYFWMEENVDSLNEFAKWVGGTPTWSVGLYGHSYAKVELDWHYIDYPARVWLEDNMPQKDCPWTGYYMDDILLDNMKAYLNPFGEEYEMDMQELVDECVDAWVDAVIQDMEYQMTEEYLIDHAQANDYLFYENGERF